MNNNNHNLPPLPCQKKKKKKPRPRHCARTDKENLLHLKFILAWNYNPEHWQKKMLHTF